MAPHLTALAPPVAPGNTTGQLTTDYTYSTKGSDNLSFGLHGYQACTWYTHIHVSKTLTHIK